MRTSCWRGEYKPGSTEALALKAPLFTWSVKSDSGHNVPWLWSAHCMKQMLWSSAEHSLAQVRPRQIFTRTFSKNGCKCDLRVLRIKSCVTLWSCQISQTLWECETKTGAFVGQKKKWKEQVRFCSVSDAQNCYHMLDVTSLQIDETQFSQNQRCETSRVEFGHRKVWQNEDVCLNAREVNVWTCESITLENIVYLTLRASWDVTLSSL